MAEVDVYGCHGNITLHAVTSAGSYDGGASDLGWIAGFLLIALSSVAHVEAEAEDSDRSVRGVSFLPYVPVAIAAVILVIGMLTHHEPTGAQTALIGVCIGLVLLRQYLTLRENSSLAASLAAREAELVHQAFHDGLTGLANRALFQNRLEHALDLHGRDLRPVADKHWQIYQAIRDREPGRAAHLMSEHLIQAEKDQQAEEPDDEP
jgi:hypothetical protein